MLWLNGTTLSCVPCINKIGLMTCSIFDILQNISITEFCKKSFATVPSMRRHLSTCKVKKFNQNEEITKLKEENKILKDRYPELYNELDANSLVKNLMDYIITMNNKNNLRL